MTRRREFFAGVRAQLPLQLGVVPFGMIYGLLAVQAGLSPLAAQLSSAIVFAGSAQLVIAQLLGVGAGAAITALTAAVINVRHVLYSAAAAAHVRHLPARWRLLLAYLLTDEAFAIAIGRYRAPHQGRPDFRHWYFFGSGLTLWTFWQSATALGVLFGAGLPPSWGFDFAIPLVFLALIIPAVTDRATALAAVVAAAVAVALAGLPLKLGLLCAILAGVGAGIGVDRIKARAT